jgi:hypothetical protein
MVYPSKETKSYRNQQIFLDRSNGCARTVIDAASASHFPSNEDPKENEGRRHNETQNLCGIIDEEQGVTVMNAN